MTNFEQNKVKVICLTPIKNEASILKIFLESASLWADYIIIADQNSDDDSVKIARSFSKVILVKNININYNEEERQKILINESRKIEGKKLLIALDADEALTANFINNYEWDAIKNLKSGTVIKFDWANLLPRKGTYWLAPDKMPFGFMDDGSEHIGQIIHSSRIPLPKNSTEYLSKTIKIMHFQYADWERMKSKHRWYQCWEHINNPRRSIISIYRQYHHMYAIKKYNFQIIPSEWLEFYKIKDIDYINTKQGGPFYWDYEIFALFNSYGLNFFSKIDIWDIDWREVSKKYNLYNENSFKDPRTKFEKLLNKWLKGTQYYSNSLIIKITDKLLKILFRL